MTKDYLYIGHVGLNPLKGTTQANVLRCQECGEILERTSKYTAECSCRGYGWDEDWIFGKLTDAGGSSK